MRYYLICFCAGFLLYSCTERPVTPNKDSRRAIDTLFQQKVIVLQPRVDSICSRLRDSIYTVAVDSILDERKADMNSLVE